MSEQYKNPAPTVDIIIEISNTNTNNADTAEKQIVLIKRKNPPREWALPGGFVDYGESLEMAATREAYEETCLHVELKKQFHTYSDPSRDKRLHTISTVFIATATGQPVAADDAEDIHIFKLNEIPEKLAFDHRKIINDYINNIY